MKRSIPRKSLWRGLQNIRTLSGMVDQGGEPYRAFLRIGALEMEKARRGKEKDSAIRRVEAIDGRFREIEAEKSKLLKALGNSNPGGDSDIAGDGSTHGLERGNGGFKIKY